MNKDPRLSAFSINDEEKEQLIAFLKTLSDPYLLINPEHQTQE